MTSRLEIIVVRSDGRVTPAACDEQDMVEVCRRALEIAQSLAVNGCPFGDPRPPRCVNVLEDGRLLLSVAVLPSLRPDDPPRT